MEPREANQKLNEGRRSEPKTQRRGRRRRDRTEAGWGTKRNKWGGGQLNSFALPFFLHFYLPAFLPLLAVCLLVLSSFKVTK